jgi:hypothetical protein
MSSEKHKGILLDLGCGENKRHGFVGMDKRKLKGVDIVHDLEIFPYPLESESCLSIVGSHIVEHISPFATDAKLIGMIQLLLDKKIITHSEVFMYCGEVTDEPKFIRFMNEVWRLLKFGGRVAFSLPYGVSFGYQQDPTHINPCNEATWQYFDPDSYLWYIYRPKPFKIIEANFHTGGNQEVLLEKRASYINKVDNKEVKL